MNVLKKRKIFTYLHRDGDQEMSTYAVMKRQLAEWFEEIWLARKQFTLKEFIVLAYWITAYHLGMFLHPKMSTEKSKIRLVLKGIPVFVEFRQNQSDLYILRENFILKIYDFAYEEILENVKTIIDLGANIGLSSLYLQARFPKARIVCVEPVKENVELLRQNAHNNNFSWKVERAAIQAKSGTVTLYPNEWWSSSTVTEHVATTRQSKDGRLEKLLSLPTEDVEAVSVNLILDRNQIETVDILKMDIEGAEEQLFLESPEWLQRIRVLIIEIHDKYVDRKKITQVLTHAGFHQISGRKGPTDVFVNKGAVA
ncbi:FkbM family methyltransferase [bacterium]|nr:FkbM family methyltransferase [bacterium]